jgi:iron-sulfur cluster assembly protein
MQVSLTPAAARHVEKSLAKRGSGLGLRLAVKTSGCSGFAYALEFVDNLNADDQCFETQGTKLIIDAKSLAMLDGTELDFVREGLNEGFKFNNPNAKNSCGCGESFAV